MSLTPQDLRKPPTRGMWPILAAGLALAAGVVAASPQAVVQPLDISSPISYFIGDGRGKGGFRSSDGELARWALQAWQRTSGDVIRFEPAPESSALVRLYWAQPTEGQYGEMQSLVVGGRIGAAVYIRPDMTSLGPDIAERAARDPLLRESIVYLTCVHELGHALGLRHTRDYADIMYYFGFGGDIPNYFGRYRAELRSRADIAKVSGLSSGDVMRLKALYQIGP
jgi:Matrixin